MKETWWEKNQYTYYKLPKFLLEGEPYRTLSDGAKVLFCLILDRMSLSARNGLTDGETVYVLFPNKEIRRTLHWSHDKATRRLEELERCGLITRKKTKLGRPDRISVSSVLIPRSEGSAPRNAGNEDSGVRETRTPDCEVAAPIKKDYNKTDSTKINPSISGIDADAMEQEVQEQIDYDVLTADGFDKTFLDALVRVMVDTYTGTSPKVRISGSEMPRSQVCERLRSLNMFHIQYVLDCLKKSTTNVRNMKAYMLTSLYKAPETMDAYYQQQVQRDLARERSGSYTPNRSSPPMTPPQPVRRGDRRGDDLPY